MEQQASIIDIVSDESLNVAASPEEVREHAKYLIKNEMSILSEDDLTSDLLARKMTRMYILAIEKAHSSGQYTSNE